MPCPPTRLFLWLLLVAAPAPRAEAALRPPVKMAVEREEISVPLGAWERGRLHMYLEQNGFGCMLAKKPAPRGALSLRLEVVAGQPARVTIIDDSRLAPRAFGACLRGMLRSVGFEKLAPRFQWEGTLRYDPDDSVDVEVRSLYGRLMELTLEHVVIAALTPGVPCMQPFFAAKPEMSFVLMASFDVDAAGATSNVEAIASTVGPEETVACVRQRLAGITYPPGTLTGAKLRLSLVRVHRGPPDADVPTIRMVP